MVAPPTPYAIFERAREVWSTQRYPRVLSYVVDVEAAKDDAPQQRHYHEYWDSVTDAVYVKPPVSDEQLDHPYKPSAGVNFMGWNIGGPREGTGVRDFISVPQLAPNYSFGLSTYIPPDKLTPAQLVQQIRNQYHDPSPQKIAKLEQQSGLKTIALVTSSARAYRISLVGVEREQEGPAYHLKLQPLEDPLKYRLRDLWIDKTTYETERARIGANFTDAATEQIPWMVRFRQVGDVTYIASEVAERPIVGYRGLMYTHYKMTFSIPQAGSMPQFAQWTGVSQPLLEP
jgi:hypothetical protein